MSIEVNVISTMYVLPSNNFTLQTEGILLKSVNLLQMHVFSDWH